MTAEKSFECSLETIKEVRQWVVDVLSAQQAPEDVINDVVLAVSEAVTNAVVHGYEKTHKGRVDLSVHVSNATISLTVRDYGSGFGQKFYTAPDTGTPHEGGYGVYLVHSLMDEVRLLSHDEGTELQMKKVLKLKPGS